MPSSVSFALLLLCFFLSGLAGLIYETAWTREFSFVFGTSSLAISTVLAAYMGGLGAGAALASRFAHRITRPILAYGLLELGIAAAALAIPFAVEASRALYLVLFGGQGVLPSAGGLGSGLFYAVCSFGILMVPTAMMGATLPLLARHAVRNESEITGRIGVLYAVNTAGAVAGTLIAAYGLLPAFGLRNTIWVAAAVNALVFALAWALARSAPAAPSAQAPKRLRSLGRNGLILPLICASGAVSFAYEVLWVRLLDHVLDGSSYSFATMLASFLTGIALGSSIASRLGRTARSAAMGFAVAQLGTAALFLTAYFAVDRIPDFAAEILVSGTSFAAMGAILSMLTLFPGALCIGATFPFAVRILARDEHDAGATSARVYSANTLGSIVGSLAAGFLLIPWLGYQGTIFLCIGANLVIAAASSFLMSSGRVLIVGVSGLALLALAVSPPQPPWRLLLTGVNRPLDAPGEVVFAKAGRSTTVVLRESMGRWKLVTSGMPEATIDSPFTWHGALSIPRWIAMLPVLARPDLERLLVIGLGGGVSLESVPPSVDHVSVVELEPRVVQANRAIGDKRWLDPLAEDRVELQVNDARNALLLTEARFGAIVSQPSHPWRGGAAHLYTEEFFKLARSRMEADGVLVQWMGQQFLDEELFAGFLATLHSAFGFVRVYAPTNSESVIFVASNAPLDLEATAPIAIEANREALGEHGITVVEDVSITLILDERGARNVAREGISNRDDHNRLQIRSSLLGNHSLMGRVHELYGPFDPLAEWRRAPLDPFLLLERAELRRARRLVGIGSAGLRMPILSDPDDRRVARALVQLRSDDDTAAIEALAGEMQRVPRHAFGRAALLRSHAAKIKAGLDPETVVAPPLEAAERALALGWRTRVTDTADRSRIEAELASIDVRDPLHRDAQLLIAQWQIESGDPALAELAIARIDRVLRREPADFLLRARACVAAGHELAALDTLNVAGRSMIKDPKRAEWVPEIREILSKLTIRPEHQRLRVALDILIQSAEKR